jgi:hypothetical protein
MLQWSSPLSIDNNMVNDGWQQILVHKIYTEASEKVLGFKRQVHKEWKTPETWKLIDERKVVNKKICQTRSERIKEKLRTRCFPFFVYLPFKS